MDNNLSKKVFEKIQQEHIKPKSKYVCTAHKSVFWAALTASVIIGALAVSVVIFILTNNDWEVYSKMNGGAVKMLLLVLPYFWFVIFGLFVSVAYYNYKHTKSGYKHRFSTIIFGYFVITIIVGTGFSLMNLTDDVDEVLVEKMPFYEEMNKHRRKMWQQPEKGFLTGKVIVVSEDNLNLIDLHKQEWVVYTKKIDEHGNIYLLEGKIIGISGEKVGNNEFVAQTIRPLFGKMPRKLQNHMINFKQRQINIEMVKEIN